MSFTYTADELKRSLQSDPLHGSKYSLVLKKMASLNHSFTVESLFARDFSGGHTGVRVSTGARTLPQALEWAQDGLREWAHGGIDINGNYFGLATREWAITQNGNSAKCCGSTVDFLYLFSGNCSKTLGAMMYNVKSTASKDLFDILCWAFANMWSVINPAAGAANLGAKINIDGSPGPPGLHPDYWDSLNNTHDQTHHFAFYFSVGAHIGSNIVALQPYLTVTKDIDLLGNITNAGDYNLGITSAKLGLKYSNAPGFKSAEIEAALLAPFPKD